MIYDLRKNVLRGIFIVSKFNTPRVSAGDEACSLAYCGDAAKRRNKKIPRA